MRIKNRGMTPLLLTTVLLPGFASSESILEEVIVTAEKKSEKVNDVSLSVSAFSGEVTRTMGVEEPRDIAMMVPNVDIKGASQGDAVADTGEDRYCVLFKVHSGTTPITESASCQLGHDVFGGQVHSCHHPFQKGYEGLAVGFSGSYPT